MDKAEFCGSALVRSENALIQQPTPDLIQRT